MNAQTINAQVVSNYNYHIHAKGEDQCSGLRWALMDTKSKKTVEDVRANIELILGCYPDLKELDYSPWQDLLKQFFWPLVSQQS